MRVSTRHIAATLLLLVMQAIRSGAEEIPREGAVHEIAVVLFKENRAASASEVKNLLDNSDYRVDSIAFIRYRNIPVGSTRTSVIRMYLRSKPIMYVDVWTPDPGTTDSSAFKTALIGVVNWLNIGVVTSKGEFNLMEINAHYLQSTAERDVVLALASICCDTTKSIQSTVARLKQSNVTVSFERYGRKGDVPFPTVPVTHLIYRIADTYLLWLRLAHDWRTDRIRGNEIESDVWLTASCDFGYPRRMGDLAADVTPYGSHQRTLNGEDIVRTVFR
jgi:hypothetical protein